MVYARNTVSLVSKVEEIISDTSNRFVEDIRLYIDLQGSKMRQSKKQKVVKVKEGEVLRFICNNGDDDDDDVNDIGVNYESKQTKILITREIIGRLLSIKDETSKLSIEDVGIISHITKLDKMNKEIFVTVDVGGIIRPRKGVNITPHPPSLRTLSERDREIIMKTKSDKFITYALERYFLYRCCHNHLFLKLLLIINILPYGS